MKTPTRYEVGITDLQTFYRMFHRHRAAYSDVDVIADLGHEAQQVKRQTGSLHKSQAMC